MKYKMVVSDIDGTILDGSMTACKETIASIKKAIDSGIIFVLASGRPDYSMLQVSEYLSVDTKEQYIICFNGACVLKVDTDETVFNAELKNEYAQHIIAEAKKFNRDKTSIIAYINRKPYSHATTKNTKDYGLHTSANVVIENNFEKSHNSGYNKVLVRGDNEELVKIEKHLADWAKGKVIFFYSAPNLLEYVNLHVSKGNAMSFLADKLDIKREEIIAIGDYYNDVEMIKAAGLGVTIKDSPEDIKAIAGYVTKKTAAKGAVSEVIEKFIFD